MQQAEANEGFEAAVASVGAAARQRRARRPRQDGADPARPRGARLPGARPVRGRPGDGEDGARARRSPARSRAAVGRIQCTPDLQPTDITGLSVWNPDDGGSSSSPGPIFANVLARRRDQPRAAEGAVGAARGDGRAAGHGRRRHAPPARPVPPARDGEHDRAGGDVPAPRGAARPLPRPHLARLPDARRGARDRRRAAPRAPARRPPAGRRRSTSCAASSPRVEEVYIDPLLKQWAVELVRATRSSTSSRSARPCAGASRSSAWRRAWALVHGRDYVVAEDIERALPARRDAPAGARRRRPDGGRRGRRAISPAGLARLPRARPAAGARPGTRTPRPPTHERRGRAAPFPLVPQRRFAGVRFGAAAQPAPGRGGRGRRDAAVPARRPHERWIDWRASARLSAARGADEFVMREFFADQAPRVVVVCDRRPGMGLYDAAASLARQGRRRRGGDPPARRLDARGAGRSRLRRPRDGRPEPGWRREPLGARGSRPLAAPRLARPVRRAPPLARSCSASTRRSSVLPAGTFVFVVSDFLAAAAGPCWAPLRALLLGRDARDRPGPDLGAALPARRAPPCSRSSTRHGPKRSRRLDRARRAQRRRRTRSGSQRPLDGFGRLGFDPVVLGSERRRTCSRSSPAGRVRRRRARRAAA